MFIRLLGVLITCFGLSLPVSANSACLDFNQKGNPNCRSYSYDTLHTYFEDVNGLEHQAIVNRVRDSNRKVVHADYHFVSSNSQSLADAMWAWRTAWREGQVYTYIDVCDPTLESCCDQFQNCTSPYSVTPGTEADISTQRGGKPAKPGKQKDSLDWVEQGLSVTRDTLILHDRVRNGYEMQQQVVEQNSQPLQYLFRDTNNGYYKMMHCAQGQVCKDLPGQLSWDGQFGVVDIRNLADDAASYEAQGFIRDFFQGTFSSSSPSHTGIFCTVSNSSCDPEGKKCTLHMTCHRR